MTRWWLGVAIGFLAPAAVWACPGCKEALFDPGQAHQLIKTAHGYALSISLLLLTPALCLSGLAWWIIRQARRHAREKVASSFR